MRPWCWESTGVKAAWWLFALVLTGMAGCTSVGLYTGAAGTLEEAREVVRVVYGQEDDAAIDRLPYEGVDLTRAVRRLRGRYSQLKGLYMQGVVGNTMAGFVAIRDLDRKDEVGELVRQENWDRALLYTRSSVEVGHGTDDLQSWLPYARESFGREWIAQSPAGWWYRDGAGEWQQKSTPASVPVRREPQPFNSRFIW